MDDECLIDCLFVRLKEDYANAVNAVVKRLIRYSEPNKLTFIGEILNEKSFSPKMARFVCRLLLALTNIMCTCDCLGPFGLLYRRYSGFRSRKRSTH